jgi:prophage regulatory protein
MSDQPTKAADRLIRLPEVISITGLSRSTIYALEAANKFPRRCALTEKTSAWSYLEVMGFVADRLAKREVDTKARAEVGQRLTQARVAAAA